MSSTISYSVLTPVVQRLFHVPVFRLTGMRIQHCEVIIYYYYMFKVSYVIHKLKLLNYSHFTGVETQSKIRKLHVHLQYVLNVEQTEQLITK